MMMITPVLIFSSLGTWVGLEVMACKSEAPTTPPPPACTEGDAISDDDYVISQHPPKKDAKQVVPSTVYVEVLVAIDDDLYDKIGKSYTNGKWIKSNKNLQQTKKENYLYARKFLSAVNIKFQGQFSPQIKFVLRKAFKTKIYIFTDI